MRKKRKRNKDKIKDEWGRKEKETRIRERMNEGERKRYKDKRKNELRRKEKDTRIRERMNEEERKKIQG